MQGRVLAVALVLASLAASSAPAAGPVLVSETPLDACSQAQPLPLAGFAPLSSTATAAQEASGYSCYQLYVRPGFPFRGTLTATLSDGVRTATLEQRCDFSGVDPLVPGFVGCTGQTGSAPALAPGLMTLRCSVSDPVAPLGSWECGAVFGN